MTDALKTDTLAVDSQVEVLPRWRRRLRIRVPAGHADRVRQRHVRAFAKRARLKGFRPGKAPDQLVERTYGTEIEQEVLKDLIHEGYEAAVRQASLEPVAPPSVEHIRWTPERELEFVAEVDVEPEIELGRTTGFRVERKVRRVTDEDVDRVIDRLREDRADWRRVERPAGVDDRVVFESVPLDVHGEPIETERVENHRVEIGRGTVLPDFEEGLTGRSAGESTEIEVVFPEDHPNEMLRGRTRRFRVIVGEIRERVLPELDAEFARTVAGLDSVDALRERIRSNLEQELEEQSRREENEALIDQIIEANRFEIPDGLVDRYLASMMADRQGPLEGRVPEERLGQVREILRPGAERAVRRYYILQRVARAEGLEADEAAVEAAIAERVDTGGTSVAETRRRLERSGGFDDLRHHLTMERVFEWLRKRSTIVPVEGNE